MGAGVATATTSQIKAGQGKSLPAPQSPAKGMPRPKVTNHSEGQQKDSWQETG